MCEYKIFIPLIIQGHIIYWYHTYLLRPGMDRIETTTNQHLYWPGIRTASQKEVKNYDTFQCTKRSNIKYGKLAAKEAEEIPRNKDMCIYNSPLSHTKKGKQRKR